MRPHFPQCRIGLLGLIALSASAARAADPPSPADVEFFERKVRPLLVQHCYECHSSEAKKVKGDLRLDQPEGVAKVVVAGMPAKSMLIQAVRHEGDAPKMPPKSKLSASAIADLEDWIRKGAPYPATAAKAGPTSDLWSLRPVRDVAVPAVRDSAWPRTDIDRFILAKLEAKGVRPAAEADRRALIRRATYDLTGLPPTPAEIEAFLADNSPEAFGRVVDRLLASPAYGERWGRHWLDVVRYADTAGDNSDYPVPQAIKYRDWVIAAFNRDQPYDQFVIEQLAGDLLPARDEADRRSKILATGYLAIAKRFGSYEDDRYPWYLTIEDTIDNLGRTFLGVTINCCRCHDHKFDPFTQHDYYALYGFFQSTRYPRAGIELDKMQHDFVPLAPQAIVAAADRERAEKLAATLARIKKLESDRKEAEKGAKEAEGKKRLKEIDESLKAARKEKDDAEKAPLPYETAYAVVDRPATGKRKVGNACVQIKGDPERLGPEVPRRFPTALGGYALPKGEAGSGRLALARWIADAKNPLTARVMVNRIWQGHFGRGIVPTASDFGNQGMPPSHVELLDHLAGEFQRNSWSIKAMHRQIMRSHVYQLSATADDAEAGKDADNELLGRFPRRRLSAEEIRDSLLMISNGLEIGPGGPHPFPDSRTWSFTQHNPFKAVYDSNRRSVYLMTQRIQRHPFLALFDGPDTNASTARRPTSTTSLQALYLMNDAFVHGRAAAFAQRLGREADGDEGRIERAYALLFGRPASSEEIATAREYLAQVEAKVAGADRHAKAWESLGRALFLSNEFVYVE